MAVTAEKTSAFEMCLEEEEDFQCSDLNHDRVLFVFYIWDDCGRNRSVGQIELSLSRVL